MSTITKGRKSDEKKSINNKHINAKIKILILLKLLVISIFSLVKLLIFLSYFTSK
jgi:hypothetical protein